MCSTMTFVYTMSMWEYPTPIFPFVLKSSFFCVQSTVDFNMNRNLENSKHCKLQNLLKHLGYTRKKSQDSRMFFLNNEHGITCGQYTTECSRTLSLVTKMWLHYYLTCIKCQEVYYFVVSTKKYNVWWPCPFSPMLSPYKLHFINSPWLFVHHCSIRKNVKRWKYI